MRRVYLVFMLASLGLMMFSQALAQSQPRVVILANNIDFDLSGDFLGFLENNGMETVRATADDFEQYKGERFIVILGGPDAYDGVGEIVEEITTETEQETLRERGNRRMYVKINPWGMLPGQRVTILAGSDRNQTKRAHEENRLQLANDVEEALDDQGTSGEAAVNIQGFAFSPKTLTVSKGTAVTWTNKDSVSHTTTALDATWDSGTLGNGGTYSFTFEAAGTFEYRCEIHPNTMKGTVIVQ